MKNKQYFLRVAIIKTMASGVFYLSMPLMAKIYHDFVGGIYPQYTAVGIFVLMAGNAMLLVRAWNLAFDKDSRVNYNLED